ncbi:MAG TPA: hypothetical protein VKO18_00600 [Terriglobia bacterium]|nr:hypothetical protein [Terriglobia bacterium]
MASLIFLYALLFVPPFIPVVASIGDTLYYVCDGKRMYEGDAIYRDFFQFLTPGTSVTYFLLFKIFGLRSWVPNLSVLLLGFALAGLGVAIARKLMGPSLALLPSAIFLAGIYKNQLHPIHHWYSLLGTMAALVALMERRTPARIAAAGGFCGLAASFTQTRGVAVAMAVGAFLCWESRRRQADWRDTVKKEAILLVGFLATLIAGNAYFAWKAGLARFLWCTVVFVIKYYHQDGGPNTFLGSLQDFPMTGPLSSFPIRFAQWSFIFAVVPFTYVLFFARYWRESGKTPTEDWERPMLLAMVGSSLLLSVAPAPSLGRMGPSVLPGIILLGWFLDSPRKLGRVLATSLAVGVLLIVTHAVAGFQSREKSILTEPQGPIAITVPELREELAWVEQHTRPSEYFYATADPGLYFYGDLRNPTPVPFVTDTGYTTPEQVADVIRGLEQHHVRYISWDVVELGAASDWGNPADHRLGPLWNYIHSHYRMVKVFADSDEIWERKREDGD